MRSMDFTVPGIVAHESPMSDGNWRDVPVFGWQHRATHGQCWCHVNEMRTVNLRLVTTQAPHGNVDGKRAEV